MRAIRVLVVDDQEMIRAGIRLMVDHEPDLEVVGEAGDGAQAQEAVASLAPDVVVMDIRMPVVDGIEATRRIVASGSPSAVLVLTTFDDDEFVFGALRAGAAGFLLKDSPPDDLLNAIRAVNEGGSLVDPGLTRRLIERWSALEDAAKPEPARVELAAITPREREILVGLARGWSNRELADNFFLSEGTIKSHVSSLLSKLGLRSRVQAVIYAYEAGVVRVGE
ncbi:MAG TPA: response regulator transcription factor [Acidimicrobiales bacterium]|nr:response regulator transcription factor [Acidimicrobiales bacterium]